MEHPFDELTKSLATGTSRRGIFKALAACAAGLLLSVTKAAAGQCKPPGSRCNHHSHCCSGYCQTPGGHGGCGTRPCQGRDRLSYCA